MQKWLIGLIYLAILLAFFPFDTSVYMQVGVAAVILLSLVWGVAQGRIRFRQVLNPYTVLMAILLLWSLLSIFWVVDRASWITANGILFVTVVFAFALSYLLPLDGFRKQLSGFLVGIVVVHNLVAWYDLYRYMGSLTINIAELIETFQLSGGMTFFGNVNDFALLSLFGLIFVLSWQPFEGEVVSGVKKGLLVGFKGIFILSSLLMIYFVHSRGILFAAFYAIIFYFILQIRQGWLRRITLGLILLAALMTVVLMYSEIMDALWSDGSFVVRLNLIRNGWQHLKASNYLGVGAGNTEYYMAHFNYHYTAGYNVMHNWWMGMLVEYGVPFFIVYALYHVRVFLTAFYWSVAYKSGIGKFVATWLLAFIVAGFIPNTLFNFLWFWLIHNFVFVWFEYRAGDVQYEGKQVDLDFGLKERLNRVSDWLEARLVS